MENIDANSCLDIEIITSFVKACHRASNLAHLRSQIYPMLQKILPHVMFACGKVCISDLRIVELVNLTFPDDYLIEAKDKTNPMLRRWLALRNPTYIDADSLILLARDNTWLDLCEKHNVRNLAMHGVFELNQKYASFFTFGNIDGWTEHEAFIVQLLVPQLHCAYAQLDIFSDMQTKIQREKILTKREEQVLMWISNGKSNAEIARILNISPWTVKIHVSNLISKLNVSNRCHAAAKAIDSGLLKD